MSRNQDYSINEFFDYIYRLANESERRYSDANIDACNLMIDKLSTVLSALDLLQAAKENCCPELEGVTCIKDLKTAVGELLLNWRKLHEEKANVPCCADYSKYKCDKKRENNRGRPSYVIDIEIILNLQALSFKWNDIATMIGVHRTTLWRYLSKNHPELLESKYTDIRNTELDEKISLLKQEHPLAGERMIIGFLRAKGIHVQRFKVRESIHRVDPVNTAIRWIRKNPRWVYSVPGPNSLWHNDGLHKLINWKIVVHGCIDGFSRLITYLKCAPNNLATTVLSAFLEAIEEFGTPARMRGDHGGENIRVAEYLRNFRDSQGAYIQGPSVHNQRIERLHYDTTHCVLSHYISLFKFMEEQEILDRCDDLDIYCLHQVFLPRIQSSLDQFRNGWNHHQISTEKNKSPFQLFTIGMMNSKNKDQPGVSSYIGQQDDMYGAILSSSTTEYLNDNYVEVEDIVVPDGVSHHDILFDLNSDDGNFGVNHYIRLKNELDALR